MQIFIFILIFWLISEIAGTIAWFWSSSIFLPLVSQLLNFKNALIIVAIYHIFWNSSRLLFFHKYINWKIFFLFWLPSIITTIIGASISNLFNQNILKMILWCILFSFALYAYITPKLKVSIHPLLWVIGWWLSGFTAWIVWTWWVLRWAFMSIFQLKKEEYLWTIACVALLVDFTRIPLYISYWYLDNNYLTIIPMLFFIALLWSYIGKKIIFYLSEDLFKKIILIGVMTLSLLMVFQWCSSFLFS